MGLIYDIINNNILPIFVIVVLGIALEKKYKLDINTLSKINFYVVVPIYLFVSLYESKFSNNMGKVFIFLLIFLLVNFYIGKFLCKLIKINGEEMAGLQNSIMFYNSGNMGIPIITLVFSNAPFVVAGQTPFLTIALTVQVIVMVVQNITLNTIGFINMGRSKVKFKDSIKRILFMPVIYVIPVIIAIRYLQIDVTGMFFWESFEYIKSAMISIALLTLGIQIGKVKFNFKSKVIYLATFVRLVIGPLLALIIMKILNINGTILQSLFIAVSMPTAVNVALISVECDTCQDTVTQIVMLSTLLSPITITLAIGFMIKFLA